MVIGVSSKNVYKWAMASMAMLNNHRVIVTYKHYWLVVSNIWIPCHKWDVILPIDELILFKLVIACYCTTNQIIINLLTIINHKINHH